ncbi:MAG TPA: hypothetical protein VLT33_00460, partial [Labilithrix sp.]|nr:hypothetical protein [Labilithrix sp.]
MSNPRRSCVTGLVAVAATATALLLASHSAHASGAVLPPIGAADPSTVDVEMAVAVTAFGSTRWSRLTVGGAPSVMWLVPARPGAALDWASDAWLGALHDASTPRVAPPSAAAPCQLPTATERVAAWETPAAKKFPRAVSVHASESDLRAHLAGRGFEVPAGSAAKIAEVYGKGYALVSVEIDTAGGTVSTPTLRVSDDGVAILPLALTGSRETNVRVTAMVIGEGGAQIPGARPLAADALTWGKNGSSFASARATALVNGGGATWIRESASHEVLFDGVAVPRSEPIQPLVAGYFREANGQPRLDCENASRAAATAAVVGRACAAGALARVPGGAACVPSSGANDPAAFACGSGVDDLALALSGTVAGKAALTRFTGLVTRKTFGLDLPITGQAAAQSAVVYAARYEPCEVVVPAPGDGRPAPAPGAAHQPRPYHYRRESGSCSGSTTTIIYEDDGEEEVVADEGCGASSTGTTSSTT